MDPEILACLPSRIHPVSQFFLDQWLDGRMATAEFMRWFHMPNSDYLSVTECILAAVTLIGT